MKRKKKAQKISNQVKELLKRNPSLKRALDVFDVSYEQYQKSLQGSYSFYTGTSTSPTKADFKTR